MSGTIDSHPHGRQPVLETGASLADANGVVILLHGRGSPAANILRLSGGLTPEDPESAQRIAFFAPQAIHNTWYPHRFLEPTERNEPYLSSALRRIDELVDQAAEYGIHPGQILIGGFSQGACLALEYGARRTRPIGAVAALAGGLIGDPAAQRLPIPDLTGLSVFIGCGEIDQHIDIELAENSAQLLASAGAEVDFRRYRGIPHMILEDEIDATRDLVTRLPLIGPAPRTIIH